MSWTAEPWLVPINRGGTVLPVSALDAATTAWVAAVVANGGTVSAARETLVDNLIVGLKADGLFTKLDRLWLFAAENAASALTDIIADQLATAINTPTFAADDGYTSTGAGSYLDSNFNALTAGGLYTQDAASLFCWDNTGAQNAIALCGVTAGTNRTRILPRHTTDNTFWAINRSQQAVAIGNYTGLFLAVRTSSTASTLDLNGVEQASDTNASTALESFRITACTDDNGATANTDQVSCLGCGGTLTGTDRTNLYTRLRTYMTAVGVP